MPIFASPCPERPEKLMPHFKIIVATLLATTLAGCFYPVHKTLQPAATARVFDSTQQPASNATVTLVSSSVLPVPFEILRTSVPALGGQAEFHAIKDWRIEALTIGGMQFYQWTWCVTAPGHETLVSGPFRRGKFDDEPRFVLTPGTPSPCPTGADTDY